MSAFDVAARAGAELLDGVQPGWLEKIDLDALKMNNYKVCILGQIYGDYSDGLARLNLSVAEAPEFGFQIQPDSWADGLRHPDYVPLRQAWVDLIVDRSESARVAELVMPEIELPAITSDQRTVLTLARELIADRQNWTTNVLARAGQGGHPVDVQSPQATCFCAAGAIKRAAVDAGHMTTSRIANRICNALDQAAERRFGDGTVARVNDVFGHDAVLLIFDDLLNQETPA